MSRISVDVSSARIPVLQVGYQGENEVTDVLFDISSWITEFGEGVAQLRVKRPGNSEEESYVLSLTITDGKAVWTVSETDTANKGSGKVQLSYMVGNIVKKAVIYPYKVGKSIVGADNPVDPFDSWIERSKAWAIGKTLEGDDVPETDETYQNNAKYYAEQADILGSAQVVLAAEKVTLAAEQVTLATEKADAAAASEAAVNGVSTQLTTRMSAIETEQAVQDARMDTFTSLPEGSTSGNAELADIRVGADGTTYDTAGNAVRGQIGGLKSDLTELSNTVNGEYYQYAFEWEVGQLDKGVDYDNNYYYRTKSGVYYEFTEPLTITVADGYRLTVESYSSEKVYVSRANITATESPFIYPIDRAPYYRLQLKKTDGSGADATWLNGVTFESSLMNVGLVGRVETLENQSTSILNGKIWASFGDSITAGNNLLETETNWSDRVANDLGCTHINCGVGSSRVAGSQSSAFHQDARLDAVKNANPDIVTILGGANDLVAGYSIGTVDEFAKALEDKNKSTYLGAYSYIVENLLTWKPELDIVILGMYYAWNDGKDYSETNTYTDFSNASKQLAEYYGLPFVDLHNLLGFNQFTMGEAPYNTYTRDKIHPNDKGCEKIASVVKAKFIELFN